jgi:hypothetical protein
MPPVSLIPAAILLTLSLASVANLPPVVDNGGAPLLSPRIFKKIRNGSTGILWGWGESDS